MKDKMNSMNPKEIDSYIQNMMKNMFPNGWEGMMNPNDAMKGAQPFTQSNNQQSTRDTPSQKIPTNIFETFEDVFLRLQISNEEWMKQLRIFHTSNQAIIENIPEVGDRQVITLPALVKKKGAVAQYKDGILELKIPKSIDMQYTEIDVSERY